MIVHIKTGDLSYHLHLSSSLKPPSNSYILSKCEVGYTTAALSAMGTVLGTFAPSLVILNKLAHGIGCPLNRGEGRYPSVAAKLLPFKEHLCNFRCSNMVQDNGYGLTAFFG